MLLVAVVFLYLGTLKEIMVSFTEDAKCRLYNVSIPEKHEFCTNSNTEGEKGVPDTSTLPKAVQPTANRLFNTCLCLEFRRNVAARSKSWC